MIYDDFETFAAAVPNFTPIAGLDFGDKTVGVAISDRMGTVATPLETIKRKKSGHRSLTEPTITIIDHFHITHFSLPDCA